MYATSISTERMWYNRHSSSGSGRAMHHLQSPRAGRAAGFHLCVPGTGEKGTNRLPRGEVEGAIYSTLSYIRY